MISRAEKNKKNFLLAIQLRLILKQEEKVHNMINQLKQNHSSEFINELRYKFANHHFQNREYSKALFRYQKIQWEYLPAQKREMGLWQQFYSNLHEKNIQDELLLMYEMMQEKNFYYQKYFASICYWGEKIQGRKNGADHPCFRPYILSYYGWRSLGKAEIDFSQIAPMQQAVDFSKERNIRLIQKIYDLKEEKFANYLVWSYIAKLKTVQNFQKSAYLFSQSQQYQQLIFLSHLYQNLQKNSETLKIWLQAYFPLAYKEKIISLAKKNNLEPALILALIREESHFDAKTISSAGAIGLMQLMPFTAKDVAKRKKLPLDPENFIKRVQEVDLNLDLGITYLAWEMKRFQGQVPYALAAYNGGGGNVRKWKKKKYKDFDYWLEAVPFLETKNYVKKVMRSYYIYRYLYKTEWEE